MGGEIVHGQAHSFVVAQASNLLHDEFVIENFGRVEIHPRSLLLRQMREVPIVAVKRQHTGIQRSGKMRGQVRFSRARRTGNANEIYFRGHVQCSVAQRLARPCDDDVNRS